MVTVGRVVRPHGNKGNVVVAPETDFGAARFGSGATVSILDGDDIRALRIVGSREHDGRWVVGFEGVGTIDDAERLRGRELKVPAETLQPLEDGRYYVHDLVACEVVTIGGEAVGRVDRVEFGTGTPVLVVTGRRGEVLVPLAGPICRRVDPAAHLIVIDPPEGLIELNAGRR
ncbi:MAG TPA: ribosome maturation factor RimM [Vicinamibacterales bacterium]|nr:ribosome maturation factor RimM [Vicinamibacterales bacterium]